MRPLPLLFACAVMALPAAPTAAQPTDVSPASGPAGVVRQFHAALRAGDAKAAAALLADELVVYEEGFAEDRGAYLSGHLASDIAFSKSTTSNLVRSEAAGDERLAWVTSESGVRGTFNGKPVERVSTETMVLRNTSAGWRIVHIHWSSRPVKPGA
jgi:ketosteroid isomerase-like protein